MLNRKACDARDGGCLTHLPPLPPSSQSYALQQPDWGDVSNQREDAVVASMQFGAAADGL